jgi:hypothetical protein
MYHAVLGASESFRTTFTKFWDLPDDWQMPDPDRADEEVD